MVSAAHVKELLESSLEDPHLILETGKVSVVDGARAEGDPSALIITSAREVREDHKLDANVAQEQLDTIAALLDDRVSKLGA